MKKQKLAGRKSKSSGKTSGSEPKVNAVGKTGSPQSAADEICAAGRILNLERWIETRFTVTIMSACMQENVPVGVAVEAKPSNSVHWRVKCKPARVQKSFSQRLARHRRANQILIHFIACRRCEQRKHQSPEEWIAENYHRVIGFVVFKGCREPFDVAHDAWLRSRKNYNPDYKFRPFFYFVLRCAIADYFRARKRKPPGESFDEYEYEHADRHDRTGCSPAEEFRLFQSALEQLPEIYRQALVAYYDSEFEVSDIAINLGISEGCLKMRLMRGRNCLSKLLAARGVTSLVDLNAVCWGGFDNALASAWPSPSILPPRKSCRSKKKKSPEA